MLIGYWVINYLICGLIELSILIDSRCLNSFHHLITYTVRYYAQFCMFAASIINHACRSALSTFGRHVLRHALIPLGKRPRTCSGVGRGWPGWQIDMYVVNSESKSTNSRVRRSPICEKIQQIAERISSIIRRDSSRPESVRLTRMMRRSLESMSRVIQPFFSNDDSTVEIRPELA